MDVTTKNSNNNLFKVLWLLDLVTQNIVSIPRHNIMDLSVLNFPFQLETFPTGHYSSTYNSLICAK